MLCIFKTYINVMFSRGPFECSCSLFLFKKIRELDIHITVAFLLFNVKGQSSKSSYSIFFLFLAINYIVGLNLQNPVYT